MALPLWLRRPSWWPVLSLPVLVCVSLYVHKEYHYKPATAPVSRSEDSRGSAAGTGFMKPIFKHLDPNMVYDCVTWRPNKTTQVHTKKVRILKPSATMVTVSADQRLTVFVQAYETGLREDKEWPLSKLNQLLYGTQVVSQYSPLQQSQTVISVLHNAIAQLKAELNKDIISLLDLPCGYHQDMNAFLKTRDDIEYTGADIVPALIDKHVDMYKGNPVVKFMQLDIVNSRLNASYDIILCRMMLQHLTRVDVMSALYHFSESGSRYLIATTFAGTKHNTDASAETGIFRPLNLEISPVNLRSPICRTRDSISKDHYLGMWKLPLAQYT